MAVLRAHVRAGGFCRHEPRGGPRRPQALRPPSFRIVLNTAMITDGYRGEVLANCLHNASTLSSRRSMTKGPNFPEQWQRRVVLSLSERLLKLLVLILRRIQNHLAVTSQVLFQITAIRIDESGVFEPSSHNKATLHAYP